MGSEQSPKKLFWSNISKIQNEVKVLKENVNNFGRYNYRSCEDILAELKPILLKYEYAIILSDEVVIIGERYYIKARAEITNGEFSADNNALARESFDKKGMDDAQITGSASSYARKFALSGLLGLDDEDDADAKDKKKIAETKQRIDTKNQNTEDVKDIELILGKIRNTMALITDGMSLDDKGKAMMELLGVSKFDDLKSKSLSELNSKNNAIDKTYNEMKERAKRAREKTAKDNTFKVE